MECFHAVLLNSNHNALKSYRLNKRILLIFADDVFNKFDYNLVIFINNKYNQLKIKPFKSGGSFDCYY